MSPMFIILSVIFITVCSALITVILMQKKRAGGLSGSISGSGGAASGESTYWDKNKNRSLEGKLEMYTKIGATLFFLFSFLFAFIR